MNAFRMISGARKIVEVCTAVKPGEKVVIVTDSSLIGIADVLAAAAHERDAEVVITVMATYLGVNLVLGSFLEPKILGRQLNLSPLVIIISVVVWAGIWGVVGTFLAVPLTAAMQIILASSETTRPIAVMLSSGPPRDERRKRRKAAA